MFFRNGARGLGSAPLAAAGAPGGVEELHWHDDHDASCATSRPEGASLSFTKGELTSEYRLLLNPYLLCTRTHWPTTAQALSNRDGGSVMVAA